jgi:putative pyruvate formate lyase activating enzyme
MDEGELFDDSRLAQTMLDLQSRGCHNINFVSPTHNVAPILRAVLIAAEKGLRLPLVWNTGGYDSVASLRILEDVVDIYMPDAKYASRAVGRKLSKVDNYPEINQAAIKEMQRQVGELQLDPKTGLARRGVLVRHLVLPCDLGGTCDIAAFLAKEISPQTYANVMDQYRPEHLAVKDKKFGLSRRPTRKELRDAHKDAKTAGLSRLDGEPKTKRTLEW